MGSVFYWHITVRNLHINGIDELLLFLGSNPNEVLYYVWNCFIFILTDSVVYACIGNIVSSTKRTSNQQLCNVTLIYTIFSHLVTWQKLEMFYLPQKEKRMKSMLPLLSGLSSCVSKIVKLMNWWKLRSKSKKDQDMHMGVGKCVLILMMCINCFTLDTQSLEACILLAMISLLLVETEYITDH